MNGYTLPCPPDQIDSFLARPTPGALETLKRHPGDVLVVGAGGKMGTTLCLMAQAALREINSSSQVWAVSRFTDVQVRETLESAGVETLACDLLDRGRLEELPDVPNVLYLAGQKFGTSERPDVTWVMNTLVPSCVAEHFASSRIVAFSTGCVYSFAPVSGGGSREGDLTQPPGEYPNSCLGRERIFEYFSRKNGTPVTLYRLNYSVEFRYGVLVDIAERVAAGQPIDVSMGYVNVIWQGDACARALQCLDVAASPAVPINIAGPEIVSVRALAERFGALLGKVPKFTGKELDHAWLNDASKSYELFGKPTVALDQMIDWVAAWIRSGGETFGKPTHFENSTGNF